MRYVLSGVRPSSGAETSELQRSLAFSNAAGCSELAAPEDGRTPPALL